MPLVPALRRAGVVAVEAPGPSVVDAHRLAQEHRGIQPLAGPNRGTLILVLHEAAALEFVRHLVVQPSDLLDGSQRTKDFHKQLFFNVVWKIANKECARDLERKKNTKQKNKNTKNQNRTKQNKT
jgi:hypothetical protein